MKLRQSKLTDQDNARRAYELLLELLEKHQHQIEPALWMGPMIKVLADAFEDNRIPFDLFVKTINEGMEHYKY